MRNSLRIGSMFGIPVLVHVSFSLIVLLGAVQGGVAHGSRGILFGVASMLIIFASVVLHELGHALMARRFGIQTVDVTLYPLGGIARMSGEAKSPWQDVAISVAGPAVNLLLFIGIAAIGLQMGFISADIPKSLGATPQGLLLVGLTANLMLFLFNLLPFFPLDGGRILRSLLTLKVGASRATLWAARTGQAGAVAIGLFGILSGNLLTALVAGFLFISASQALAQSQFESATAHVTVGEAYERGSIILEPAMQLHAAFETLRHSSQVAFPVALEGQLLGAIHRDELLAKQLANESHGYVSSIMHRSLPEFASNAPLGGFLELAKENPRVIAAVREEGALLGFLTLEHVLKSRISTPPAPEPGGKTPAGTRGVLGEDRS
ncbi:MAG: site-2 protease family protein [Polyangiaceae bacterium]|nr:site-2 protease family protein [Polyangiaceae bacterium]